MTKTIDHDVESTATGARRKDVVADLVRRHQRWILPLLVVLMLGQMLVAMLTAAEEQSPIVDEPVYIGAAVVYLQRHSLQVNPEHPPLAKLVSAVGLRFADAGLNPRYRIGSQWQLGDAVLYRMGNDGHRLLWYARLPLIILTLLFGLVVFAFGRDLFGAAGGLLALGLYSFSPDVIAHGSLATNDVPVAGFLVTTMWLLWRSRSRPRLYLVLAGLAYGCALATKMTALTVFPVVLLLAGVSAWKATTVEGDETLSDGRARWPHGARLFRVLGIAAGVGLISIVTVWATYLVIDPSLRFARPPQTASVTGLTRLVVELLPFPDAYRGGMLIQLAFEQQTFGGYLFGRHYEGGRWYYLPAAILVKTPLGMLALWLGGIAGLLAIRRLRPMALYLLLPLAVLLPVAMAGERSLGVRYVIWLPVFLAVASAAVLAYRRRWALLVAPVLITFVAVSSLRTFPYYLPYSNEAFGGPSQTYRYLNDSNVDWGQDLRRLGQYLAEHPTDEQIWLIYKGRGDPSYYGVHAEDPTKVPPDQVHGLLAVSVMRLSGSPDGFAGLIGGRTPITTIGHTIRVYRIP